MNGRTLACEASTVGLPVLKPQPVPGMGDAARQYAVAARTGDNSYTLFLHYLHEAQRIIARRHAGKRRRTSSYIAKGGIRK